MYTRQNIDAGILIALILSISLKIRSTNLMHAYSVECCDLKLYCCSDKRLFIYLFIYKQIPPQSEENNILHKNSISKILVPRAKLTAVPNKKQT